ncbi:MAG: hypothetical protein WC939_00360 [Acholeplasmataceae bacterium]
MSKSIYEEALEKIDVEFDSWDRAEYFELVELIERSLEQAQKQEKLIQKLKSNLSSGYFEDTLEHTNKDGSSKNNMYNKGLYDMVNAIEEYILQE